MYEVICPACRKMVDVPVHVAVIGVQFKCPKCWTVIEVKTDRPLGLAVSTNPRGNIVRAPVSSNKSDRSESDE